MTPVGIIGGPLTIANMLSGIIEWQGIPQYLVNWWEIAVSEPMGRILGWLFGLVSLPQPPRFVADYLTLGLIYATTVFRTVLITLNLFDMRLYGGSNGTFRGTVWLLYAYLKFISTLILWVFIWPYAVYIVIREVVDELRTNDNREERSIVTTMITLLFVPFLLFLFLLCWNVIGA